MVNHPPRCKEAVLALPRRNSCPAQFYCLKFPITLAKPFTSKLFSFILRSKTQFKSFYFDYYHQQFGKVIINPYRREQ